MNFLYLNCNVPIFASKFLHSGLWFCSLFSSPAGSQGVSLIFQFKMAINRCAPNVFNILIFTRKKAAPNQRKFIFAPVLSPIKVYCTFMDDSEIYEKFMGRSNLLPQIWVSHEINSINKFKFTFIIIQLC